MPEADTAPQTPPLTVDDDELYDGVELPEAFLRIDGDGAPSASRRLSELLRKADELYGDLELIERALRLTSATSERSRTMRASVRQALAGLEHTVVGGIDSAHIGLLRDCR